jgi:uncharacterized protein (TIGR00369 family)
MKRPTKAIARLAVAELKDKLHSSNPARQFGFVLAEAGPGRVVLRMPVDKRHMQVHGVVHGGVLAALADTAGGLVTYVSLPGVKRVATIEMKINYLEAVEGGTVEAEALLIRHGRHVAVVDCNIRDRSQRLVGKALMTFFVGPFREIRKRRS